MGVAGILKKGSLFGFSIDSPNKLGLADGGDTAVIPKSKHSQHEAYSFVTDGFEWNSVTGRYNHSEAYVRRIAKSLKFQVVAAKSCKLRTNKDNRIDGQLFILRA